MSINAIAMNAIKSDRKEKNNISFESKIKHEKEKTTKNGNTYQSSSLGIKSGLFAGAVVAGYDIFKAIKQEKFKGLSRLKTIKKVSNIIVTLLVTGTVLGAMQDAIINAVRKKQADKTNNTTV